MSTKNCCIQLDRKRDKLEQVLWEGFANFRNKEIQNSIDSF